MAEAAGQAGLTPQIRLAVALVLAFACASVTRPETLPVIAALALTVLALSVTPLTCLRRLLPAALLAAAIFLVLAFFSGAEVLWTFGPLRLRREGVEAGALIAGRLLVIVTITLSLLSTLPPHRLAEALRGLGLPALVSDILALTLRYMGEMRAQLDRAETARRLRGGQNGWRGLPERGMMIAHVLIATQNRAETVWAAMRLRGHGRHEPPRAVVGPRDWMVLGAALMVGASVVAFDRGWI